MSLRQFVPTIWSARIHQKLQETLVYAQSGVVNTDFQGELSNAGDKVFIHSHSDVTVNPYDRDVAIAYEELDDERRSFEITESDYYGVKVDDIDLRQSQPKWVDSISQNAAYQLAKSQDDFISGMYTGAGATLDDGGAALAMTAANAYETFVAASVMLDEREIPTEGRYAVVPPWLAGELLKDDKYFLKASTQSVLNGQVGTIAGISIVKSNRVPRTAGVSPGASVDNVMVGHRMAIAYGSQINKTEALRDKDSFSDLLRGLVLYGGKVFEPAALINLRVSRG